MKPLAFAVLLALSSTAHAEDKNHILAPIVIPGESQCPNCADSSEDFMRWIMDARNCAMGSYTGPPCDEAHKKFWKQYTGANGIGVRIRECSTLEGRPGGYGCYDVDLYWTFDIHLTRETLIPWAMDVMLDYHFNQPYPPFAVLKGLDIKMVSEDGVPHTVHYDQYQVPKNDSNVATAPPGMKYLCPHPLAADCDCKNLNVLSPSCPSPPTGVNLRGCQDTWDLFWDFSPSFITQARMTEGDTSIPLYDGPQQKVMFEVTGGQWWVELRKCDPSSNLCSDWIGAGFAYPNAYCQ